MKVKDGMFFPVIDNSLCKNDKGCHRCIDACPGMGVDLLRLSDELYKDIQIQYHPYIGRFIKCYKGYSSDYAIRTKSASGGGCFPVSLLAD